jgi:hypothetical protein
MILSHPIIQIPEKIWQLRLCCRDIRKGLGGADSMRGGISERRRMLRDERQKDAGEAQQQNFFRTARLHTA